MRAEILGHRTGSPSNSQWNSSFPTYLEGTKFEVQTDHNPLIHMPYMKDSHGRIGRWALALQPFNFTVKHRAGAANNNADGLS